MADKISELAELYNIDSKQDLDVIRQAFKSGQDSKSSDFNTLFLYAIIFAGSNTSYVENMIKKSISENEYVVLGIKTIIFIGLIWVLKLFGF